MRFYLGATSARWLSVAGVPLFVSLTKCKTMPPKAVAPWALDSGGYTELSKHGKWTVTRDEYIAQVRRLRDGVGMLDFACPQDWVCNGPDRQQTGLSIAEHQKRTVVNFVRLRRDAPDVTWMPVLQGWTADDYFSHVDQYAAAGVALADEALVGIGSIAGRQADPEIGRVVRHLAGAGIALHGFGVKKTGIRMYGDALASADSQAWTFDARFSRVGGVYQPLLEECRVERLVGKHPQTCSGCMRYALKWRLDLLKDVEQREGAAEHGSLFEVDDTFLESHRPAALNLTHGMRAAISPTYEKDPQERPRPLWEDEGSNRK